MSFTPTSAVTDWFKANFSDLAGTYGAGTFQVEAVFYARAPKLDTYTPFATMTSVDDLAGLAEWVPLGIPMESTETLYLNEYDFDLPDGWDSLQLCDAFGDSVYLEDGQGWVFPEQDPSVFVQEIVSAVVFYLVGVYDVANPLLFATTQGIGDRTVVHADAIFGQTREDVGSITPGWLAAADTATYTDIRPGAILLDPKEPDWESAHAQHLWLEPQRTNLIANPSFEGWSEPVDHPPVAVSPIPPPAEVWRPGIELVGTATGSGVGSVNLGSFTIGGEDPGVYYAIVGMTATDSLASFTAWDAWNLSHAGGSTVNNLIGGPGYYDLSWAFTRAISPGDTPVTAPIVATHDTSAHIGSVGTGYWAVALFRITQALGPGITYPAPLSWVGMTEWRGQASGTAISQSSPTLFLTQPMAAIAGQFVTTGLVDTGFTGTGLGANPRHAGLTVSDVAWSIYDNPSYTVVPQLVLPGPYASTLDLIFWPPTPDFVVDTYDPYVVWYADSTATANLNGFYKVTASAGMLIPGIAP